MCNDLLSDGLHTRSLRAFLQKLGALDASLAAASRQGRQEQLEGPWAWTWDGEPEEDVQVQKLREETNSSHLLCKHRAHAAGTSI